MTGHPVWIEKVLYTITSKIVMHGWPWFSAHLWWLYRVHHYYVDEGYSKVDSFLILKLIPTNNNLTNNWRNNWWSIIDALENLGLYFLWNNSVMWVLLSIEGEKIDNLIDLWKFVGEGNSLYSVQCTFIQIMMLKISNACTNHYVTIEASVRYWK